MMHATLHIYSQIGSGQLSKLQMFYLKVKIPKQTMFIYSIHIQHPKYSYGQLFRHQNVFP